MITARTLAAAEAVTAGSHTWEIVLALSTIGLAIATAVGIWASLKLAKVTEADASKLANNSVDSMENVAVHALTRADKIAALNHLARHPRSPRLVRSHRRSI